MATEGPAVWDSRQVKHIFSYNIFYDTAVMTLLLMKRTLLA